VNLLADAVELMKTIKRASVQAMKAEKPVEVCFGRVTETSPLKILVDQKMTLGKSQLVLTRNVMDYKTSISGSNIQNYYYEGSMEHSETVPVDPPHVHAVGKVKITVHNGLVVGDEVILIRQQGGQKYIVVDRIG